MMNENALQSGMGITFDLPPMLAELVDYAASHDRWLACDFELTDDGTRLAARFLRDDALARSFAVFGHDGMLGLYALWLLDDRPVVYLDSDWLETDVLCNDLQQFVALLTLGRERVGMLSDWDSDQPECERIDEFRSWAKSKLDIATPPETEALDLVSRARGSYPDLKAWIDERRTESPE
jgi:hypothetical protein